MASDNELFFPTAIDISGLDRDIIAAEAMVDDFAARSAGKLGSMPAAKLQLDGSTAADAMTTAFIPIGARIKSALSESVAPLTTFAADFNAKFNEVGATVEKLSVRIDDAMRFPAFVRRYEAFLSGFRKAFGITFIEVRKDVENLSTKGFQVEADATKLVGSFKKARDEIKRAVKPIPNDVGIALEQAFHVDASGSFKTLLAGLDEVSSEAVDRMRQMAAAVQNATGKGSRVARRTAKAKATDLGAKLAAVPPRDNVTQATPVPPVAAWKSFYAGLTASFGKVATDLNKIHAPNPPPVSGWQIAGATIRGLTLTTARLGLGLYDAAGVSVKAGAIMVNSAAKTYLSWQKLKSVTSTFGSVAKAQFPTFQKLAAVASPKISFDPKQSTVLRGMGSAARSAGAGFKSMADQVTMALGVAGLVYKATSAIASFFVTGAKGASDLNETTNRVDVTLGSASGAVKAFADDTASRFGIARGVTLDTAASFGGLGKSLGRLNGDKLASFSTGMTQLAADLSSFSNISMEDAAGAITAGLSGNESDQLKKLGVILTEDTVKSYAYSHGLAAVGTELNNQQKFMARSALITQGLSKASGDLERTQGGAANQGRKLMGSIQNLATSIGTALLPGINMGLELLNEFGSWANKTFEENKVTIQGWADTAINAFDYVVAVVHNFPAAFQVARIKIGEVLTNIGEYIAVLGPNAMLVAKYIGENWLLLIGDAFEGTLTGLKNLWSNFQKIGKAIFEWFKNPTTEFKFDWTPLLDGFQATAAKFPDLIKPVLTDMSKEMADAAKPITDEVASRRAKRALTTAAAQVVDIPIGDEALKDKAAKTKSAKSDKDELKFSGALELGSKEAYSSVVSATSGRTKGMDELNRSSRDTAANTARIANALDNPRERNRPARLEIA